MLGVLHSAHLEIKKVIPVKQFYLRESNFKPLSIFIRIKFEVKLQYH